jgi:hypothetical protein
LVRQTNEVWGKLYFDPLGIYRSIERKRSHHILPPDSAEKCGHSKPEESSNAKLCEQCNVIVSRSSIFYNKEPHRYIGILIALEVSIVVMRIAIPDGLTIAFQHQALSVRYRGFFFVHHR